MLSTQRSCHSVDCGFHSLYMRFGSIEKLLNLKYNIVNLPFPQNGPKKRALNHELSGSLSYSR